MNKEKNKKKKGFTLVELLAVILILAIIMSTGTAIYINHAKTVKIKTHAIDKQSLINSAIMYYQEKELIPTTQEDNKNYYCISVKDLINAGYHKEEEIKAMTDISNEYDLELISEDSYIKITENSSTKTKENEQFVSEINADICNFAQQKITTKPKEIYTNSVTAELKKKSVYNNYKCTYKGSDGQEKDGTYKSINTSTGNCIFDDLKTNTTYQYKVCATGILNGKDYSTCSDETSFTTGTIKKPTIEKYSYYLEKIEYKVSDGYDFDTWSNDKIIQLKYDYSNIKKDKAYIMFNVNTDNAIKSTNYNLLKCSDDKCTTSTSINKNTLLSTGYYALKLSSMTDTNTTINIRATKSNVTIKPMIYDGITIGNSASYKTSYIDNIKPTITKIKQEKTSNTSKNKVTITYSDTESKADKIFISTSKTTPTSTTSGWINLTSETTYSKTLTQQSNPYYIWLIDKAKNISSVSSVTVATVDTEEPTVTYELVKDHCDYKQYYNNNNPTEYNCWTKDTKNIKIKISDNIGLKSYKIAKIINDEVIKEKKYDSSPLTDNIELTLKKYDYYIHVCDVNDNCNYYSLKDYNLQIDQNTPILDGHSLSMDCFGALEPGEICDPTCCGGTGTRVSGGFAVETPNESGFKLYHRDIYQTNTNYFDDIGWYQGRGPKNLYENNSYIAQIKIVDNVGRTAFYNASSFTCCHSVNEHPVIAMDCENTCKILKNKVNWNINMSPTSNETKMHALNSIIAGNLSFGRQELRYNKTLYEWQKRDFLYNYETKVWYYTDFESLENWYNKSCPTTTCTKPSWSDYAKRTYTYDATILQDHFLDDNAYEGRIFPSGGKITYYGSPKILTCSIGSGFYNGVCYTDK